jgi:hypothetical protein
MSNNNPNRGDVDVPSTEYAKRQHDNWLASKGCKQCGETDPDELAEYTPNLPACPSIQRQSGPGEVFCEDCARDRSGFLADMVTRARRINQNGNDHAVAAVVQYECGNVAYDRARQIEPARQDHELGVYEDEAPYYQPEAAVVCECGAGIDHVRLRTDDYEPLSGDGDA